MQHAFIDAINGAVAHAMQHGAHMDLSDEKQIVTFLDGVIRELEAPPAPAHHQHPEVLLLIRAAVNGESGAVGRHRVSVAPTGAVSVSVALPGDAGSKTLTYADPLEAAANMEKDIKPLMSFTVRVSPEVSDRARKIFELIFVANRGLSSEGAMRLVSSGFAQPAADDDGEDEE